MKPYQERVLVERDELVDRISRLGPFIASDMFKQLPGAEQERMRRQLDIMVQYRDVLLERIKSFGAG